MDHFIQIEQMNEYNLFRPDLTSPVISSNLFSDFSDSFLIDNFNQQLFDCFLNDSITCTNYNVDYNNPNQILDKEQFEINQNELNVSSWENFNIIDNKFDSILSNVHPALTTSSMTIPITTTISTYTSSTCSVNSITPSSTYVSPMQVNSLTTLMEIPTDQFYKSDVHDLNVIINHINDDSIQSQSDPLSSNASPNDRSADNYSLSSSPLNSSFSENLDKCKKTTAVRKHKIKVENVQLTEQQLRKREQNRKAAFRYRLKKKKEAEDMENEERQLLDDLKNLENEIKKMEQSSECYENLLEEILNTYN